MLAVVHLVAIVAQNFGAIYADPIGSVKGVLQIAFVACFLLVEVRCPIAFLATMNDLSSESDCLERCATSRNTTTITAIKQESVSN